MVLLPPLGALRFHLVLQTPKLRDFPQPEDPYPDRLTGPIWYRASAMREPFERPLRLPRLRPYMPAPEESATFRPNPERDGAIRETARRVIDEHGDRSGSSSSSTTPPSTETSNALPGRRTSRPGTGAAAIRPSPAGSPGLRIREARGPDRPLDPDRSRHRRNFDPRSTAEWPWR